MSTDTYGLSTEQYQEFFENNIKFSAKLFQRAHSIMNDAGLGYLDLKTCLDLYQEAVYSANDDCRRYQKANNPEAIKDNDLYGLVPSREELMEEIQSVNAKVEALTDYISKLLETTTDGLTSLVD